MGKIRIKLVKSSIGSHIKQKRTLDALGLRKIGKEKVITNSPELLGMVKKVEHLLEVQKEK